jgi:hypothetical protein
MIVTIYKNIRKTSAGFDISVYEAFERIKKGSSKDKIEALRKEKDKEKAKIIKEDLPSICFSGKFINRSTKGLQEHSGLICLDFDKYPDNKKLLEEREFIISNKHTFACFISPSGNGLKVIVKIPANSNEHKAHFEGLINEYKSDYFDETTSDVSRVCFESYDENIYINENAEIFTKKIVEDIEHIGTSTPKIRIVSENRIIQNLLVWWNTKYGFNEGTRNKYLYYLALSFNSFGVSKNEAENTMAQFIREDFTQQEINKIIYNAYKNTMVHGTQFFEDANTIEKIEREIKNGKSDKEIIAKFPEYENKELETAINEIKESITDDEFWEYDKRNKINLVPHKFKFYLENNNFKKYITTKGVYFVKIESNLVDEINTNTIKDFVLNDLQNRKDIDYRPFDYMINNTKYFKDDYLSMLDTALIDIKSDTIDTSYVYFRNCVVLITKDKIEKIKYIDLDAYVWKKHIIDRDFIECDFEGCVFSKFLFLIAGQDAKRYSSLCTVIGYLMHTFKTSANNRAIILNDETISENPNGGSGKGLFWNALSKVKKVSSIDGKSFNFDKSFLYQTVSPDTQLLIFDDVKKNFDFERLFSIITEGMTIEKKNQDAIQIPVQKSPKIIITTNYTIGGTGGSFDRRKFEVEFSTYFNSGYTPLDEFKHMFFDEWDEIEWSKFDNFMINCCQLYLLRDLIPYETKNLDVRKYQKETSYEFSEWANEETLPFDIRIDKKAKFNEFIEEYSDFKKWLQQKKFSKWIEIYCKNNGYNLVQGRSLEMRWILIEKTC